MKLFHRMTGIVRTLALVGALSFASSRSEAISLNLTSGTPDFFASPVTNVTYDSTTGSFQAIGDVNDYQGGSVTLSNVGPYALTAWITGAGLLTNGTLTIAADIGSGVTNLLTGILNTGPDGTAFGSTNVVSGSTTNAILEFLFTVTGGNADVVTDFGGIGATNRGVILTVYYGPLDTPFGGTWTNSFSSLSPSSVADNFVQEVPEPSSFFVVLLAGGLCVMTLRARHKRV